MSGDEAEGNGPGDGERACPSEGNSEIPCTGEAGTGHWTGDGRRSVGRLRPSSEDQCRESGQEGRDSPLPV